MTQALSLRQTELGGLPAPGLYQGISFDDYARWPAINHSILRLFGRSPAHARQELISPTDETKAKALGHATHVAVLEPERFEREFVKAPPYNRRTKAGKIAWREIEAANPDQIVLPEDEYDDCLRFRDAVWAHPTAAEILRSPGACEVSASWVDAATGVPCKARYDKLGVLGGWSVIADLKTARNASRRAFERDVHTFSYHQQGAHYLMGAETLAPHERKYIFIVIEKEPPYCVAVYELEDDALDLGRDEVQKHLALYRECRETNNWPGYGDGMDYISLPSWAFRPTHGE